MKGSNTEEINSSKKALGVLGGKIEEVIDITLPFSDMKRNIIIVRNLDKLRQIIREKQENHQKNR